MRVVVAPFLGVQLVFRTSGGRLVGLFRYRTRIRPIPTGRHFRASGREQRSEGDYGVQQYGVVLDMGTAPDVVTHRQGDIKIVKVGEEG